MFFFSLFISFITHTFMMSIEFFKEYKLKINKYLVMNYNAHFLKEKN